MIISNLSIRNKDFVFASKIVKTKAEKGKGKSKAEGILSTCVSYSSITTELWLSGKKNRLGVTRFQFRVPP